MTDRELLKLALETLIAPRDAKYGRKFNDTVAALKAALEQPEQEPVAKLKEKNEQSK
jgi:hypothetical protein